MNEERTIDFRCLKYILLSAFLYLVFGLPTLLLLVLIESPEIGISFFLVGIFFFIGAPIIGVMSWLIIKGSNGSNAMIILKVIGGLPGGIYGFMSGGFLGDRIAHRTGVIILSIVFFLIGRYLGYLIGPKIGSRMIFLKTEE